MFDYVSQMSATSFPILIFFDLQNRCEKVVHLLSSQFHCITVLVYCLVNKIYFTPKQITAKTM